MDIKVCTLETGEDLLSWSPSINSVLINGASSLNGQGLAAAANRSTIWEHISWVIITLSLHGPNGAHFVRISANAWHAFLKVFRDDLEHIVPRLLDHPLNIYRFGTILPYQSLSHTKILCSAAEHNDTM
jgi:hypothetical protein